MSFDLGSQDLLKALGCMVLSGPFLTGYTQVRRTLQSYRLSRGVKLVGCCVPTYPLRQGYPSVLWKQGIGGATKSAGFLVSCNASRR